MALNETLTQMNSLLMTMVMDLSKVNKGNKSAAQRVRVGTVDLEKIAKRSAKSLSQRKEMANSRKNAYLRRRNGRRSGLVN